MVKVGSYHTRNEVKKSFCEKRTEINNLRWAGFLNCTSIVPAYVMVLRAAVPTSSLCSYSSVEVFKHGIYGEPRGDCGKERKLMDSVES